MFNKELINWYKEHKRDLPWRNTRNPYFIWISEIILQQTRIAQGLDYYQRFIKTFPDVRSLADAKEDDVLKLWQGLGYYSRARNLHEAAKQIVRLGHFPNTYESIIELKGVGDYTAAAISSFAFALPYAAVDGNVFRVLSRYLGIETPIDTTIGKKEFAIAAKEMLDKDNPGMYNQAIMDFGSTLCTPTNPDCKTCPLTDSCRAFEEKKVELLPIKSHKTKTRNRYFNYIYIHAGNYTYINKRNGNDIWKGLYELPLIESEQRLSYEEILKLISKKEWLQPSPDITVRCVVSNVRHILSHQIIYASLYELTLPDKKDGLVKHLPYVRIAIDKMDQYAIPTLVSILLQKL